MCLWTRGKIFILDFYTQGPRADVPKGRVMQSLCVECKQQELWRHRGDFQSIRLLLFLDEVLLSQLDCRAGAASRNHDDILSLRLMRRDKVVLRVADVPHCSEDMLYGPLRPAGSDTLPKQMTRPRREFRCLPGPDYNRLNINQRWCDPGSRTIKQRCPELGKSKDNNFY